MYDKLLKPRQLFRITLCYYELNGNVCICWLEFICYICTSYKLSSDMHLPSYYSHLHFFICWHFNNSIWRSVSLRVWGTFLSQILSLSHPLSLQISVFDNITPVLAALHCIIEGCTTVPGRSRKKRCGTLLNVSSNCDRVINPLAPEFFFFLF